ncbi:MAG: right-handed parallel beta-helix repeat-containing protein, partial [Thermoplasmata archaeon]|nr:right-handed parallel beta-helix repeat-containing protein [Thermoplasmata archaeon]
MKKASLAIATLVLMSSFYLYLTILPKNAEATTRYVGGTGPGNYTQIQLAIDAANPGDTIFVYSGNYSDSISIYKPLTLIGEDRDTTTIKDVFRDGIIVTADWVNFTGFTVKNCGGDEDEAGIKLNGVRHSNFANNIISYNNDNGILMISSYDSIIADNVFHSNVDGLDLEYSRDNTVSNNSFLHNRHGINLWHSNENTVSNNTFRSNSVSGIKSRYSNLNTIIDNNASSTSNGIHLLWYNNLNTIANNTVHWNLGFGIAVEMYSENNTVRDNSFIGNGNGVTVRYSDNNSVLHNTVSLSARYGIYLEVSERNRILHNTVSFSTLDGIDLTYSSHFNTISGNLVWSNWDGIILITSANNTIANNSAWNNLDGIDLSHSSNHNVVVNNTVSDNRYGVYSYSSIGNMIYHNNLENNTNQAYDDGTNSWDNGYPSGGNYWSDYNGYDEMTGPNQDQPGGDGIGDTPYDVSGGVNRDRYPFTSRVAPPQPKPPSWPLNLQATSGNQQVTLTWEDPESDGGMPITSFRLYRGTTSGGESFLVEIGKSYAYTDQGLTNGQTYYYQVSAVNGIGEGPKSNEASATPSTIPLAPVGLNALPGNEQVTLSWSPPSDDGGSPIIGYGIYRGTAPGGETLLLEIGDVLTYTDIGLANGQTYYYRVSARNSVGEGPKSNEVEATPATTPSAPRNLQAVAGNQQVFLTWDSPLSEGGSLVTNYEIYRGTSPGGETSLVMVGNVLTYTDGSLLNGQTYYYQVSAVNGVGEGPKSNEVSATPTDGPTIPSAPRSLQAFAGNQQVTLLWETPVSDGGFAITNYIIYRGPTSGGETFLVEIGDVLTYTDIG